MSLNEDYWFRGDWPPETANHVPLAASVMAIGKLLAGDEWTGGEGRDSATVIYRREIKRGQAAIAAARRGERRAPKEETPNLSSVQWLELSRRTTSDPHIPGHRRLRAAQAEIVRAAIWGEIETYYRAQGSADMTPIPADAWAAMSFDAVFKRCQTDWDNYRTRDGSSPIFVSRKSLDAYLRPGEETATDTVMADELIELASDAACASGNAPPKPRTACVIFSEWARENRIDRSFGTLEAIRLRYLRDKRRSISIKTLKKALDAIEVE